MPHNDKARHTVRFFVTSWQRLVRFAAHADTDDGGAKQGRLQAGTDCANNGGEAAALRSGIDRRIKMNATKGITMSYKYRTPEQDAAIRANWYDALLSVSEGWQLSPAIGYGLTDEDLEELKRIYHTAGRRMAYNMQRKIIDLLTDCNFHTEARELQAA